jgi:transcription termination factor NusB
LEKLFAELVFIRVYSWLMKLENSLSDLAQALRERLAIIHDEESRRNADAHMARLRTVSEKIDELQATLPQPVDPRLAHYLQRRSYDKALEYLEAAPSRDGT